eukprot:154343_1
MAKRLLQVDSLRHPNPLTASFVPAKLTPSAAIILVDHNHNKVCMVTKRKKIDWGGQTVFPGGLTDQADSKLVGYLQTHCSVFIKKYRFLFDDLLYRVNAMRELFEETGILLYRNVNELCDTNLSYPMKTRMCSSTDGHEMLLEWRRKILDDPYQFEALHRSMHTIPDILSLVPWARLQTPWMTGRRWDTRFYMCCIDNDQIDPRVMCPLGEEIVDIDWIRISDGNETKLRFPPPTMMKMKELDMICNKQNVLLNEYNNAFYARNVRAIRPKIAVCRVTNKAIIVWNRDYLYDALDLNEIECDEEYEQKQQNVHRIYIHGKGDMEVVCSYDRIYEYSSHKNICNSYIAAKL